MWRSQSDSLGARCVFCNFPFFHVPTWEVALVTFQSAPSGAHICGIGGHWYQVIVFRRIGRLLNPGRRYYNIFVRLSRHFWVFFSPILLFFARHDVKWRPCISTLRPIDIMTQVLDEGTYFSAQHIFHPANNSSWAWHTVAAKLAIWDHPKSWAHLATLPFPKPEELGDAQRICCTHMT